MSMTPLRPTLLATLKPALLVALFVITTSTAAAQGAGVRPESERLAVEVVGGTNHRVEVFESAPGGGYSQFSPPRRLAGWERPKGQTPLTAVRLSASYEGDAVRLRVAAVFDDSQPADAPGPKYGERAQELANLLAREGETITVEEFKRFGAEPLVLKVVRFEPEPEPPPIPAPARAISQLKSVEVLNFAPGGTRAEEWVTLTLVNLSSKGIVALEVGVPDRSATHTAQAAAGRVLMPPGGTFQTEINFGRGGRRTPQGYEPEPPPDALVVMSAVFEDGSYEGDTEGAARMAASQRGRLTQLARALTLVQGALGAPQLDVAALRSQVEGLRIDAEPALLEELLSQFPKLKLNGDGGRRLLAEAALGGMRSGREQALRLIEQAAGPDPRRQLESVRTQLEKGVGPRRD
jgi:hypothetical protein